MAMRMAMTVAVDDNNNNNNNVARWVSEEW